MPGTTPIRWLALLWLSVLLACAALGGWQLMHGAGFDTRVTALLPETAQSPRIERANAQLAAPFTDRFVLLLDAPDRRRASDALAERLRASGAIDELRYRPGDFPLDSLIDLLGPARYRLLTPGLADDIAAGDTAALRQQALATLVMPTALDQHPLRDPFALLDRWVEGAFSSRLDTSGELITLEVDGHALVAITGRLAGSAWTPALQSRLTDALRDFEAAHPDVQLWRSGMVFHAADGARQASREINTIGLGSLLGVLTILLLVFRSPRTLATLLLPLAAGGLFAFSLTLTLFGSIHLLTLAFGGSLIGVAIDYALHLQCARTLGGSRFRLASMLPGLALGLVTSVTAYVVQAFTPLPGLKQMAVFAALGLIGAWLSVVLWLPLIRISCHPGTERLALRLWQVLARLRGRLGPRRAALLAVAALVLVGLRLESDDSLRLINTSSPRLIEDEQLIQRELGRDTGSLYLLIDAADREAFLERAETLAAPLDRLVAEGHLGGYSSLAEHVPSHQRQRHNLALTRTLYDRELDPLLAAAGLPAALAPRARAELDAPPFLDLQAWLATSAGEADRRLWLGANSDASDSGVAGMITLSGRADAQARTSLAELAEQTPGVELVDRVARISTVLGELRRQIALWVAGALALVAALLTLRYRRRSWRVLAPAGGAILGVLSLYALLGVPINLFHQLALLLVLGIGLDAGIFMQEHPRAHHAWLAITLSILSSLLAFGLLAFSATPVLHYIGMTTLIGLAGVWLLTALVQRRESATDG
ncbi:MMPL family transporter [Kushneria aurantia]|uniref:MMPL family transporter n=1 Tax=Kushneria aurantia TaxID=504092 RepID=A0ABV6FZ61_9GAMM|nr:MMPL family transporter [Kushneria aurantia]